MSAPEGAAANASDLLAAAPAHAAVSLRNRELDGIRGWAAMAVIAQHLLYNAFGTYLPTLGYIPYIFRDGSFAVVVFFILSGDALSARFLRDADPAGVRKLALTRYFRLTGMILLSCLAVYALAALDLTPHRQAAALIGVTDWFDTALDFQPRIVDALGYSLYGVYRELGFETQASYNPFLWTMGVELLGSALLFGYMLIYPALRYKVAATIAVMVLSALVSAYAPLFFLGMLIGIARSRGAMERQGARRSWQIAALLLLLLFALWDSFGSILGEGIKGIFGGILVWSAGSIPLLKRGLTSRLSLFLGDISFPLYALQFPVMMSFTSLAVVAVSGEGLLNVYSASIIVAASLGVAIACAVAAERVEQLYLRLVSRAADRLMVAVAPRAPA